MNCFPAGFGFILRLVKVFAQLKAWLAGPAGPAHLQRGALGERAAEKHLLGQGLKFLTRNFRSDRGEIDLVFRDGDCLAFVEVRTRSPGGWTRPAATVNARKRRRLSLTALDYLQAIKNPPVKIRFDIVEVLVRDDLVTEIRHLPNTFVMTRPFRYQGPALS